MMEIEAVQRFETINGKGMRVPGEVIASNKIRLGKNPAAIRSELCIRATASLNHPGDRLTAGLEELDYLLASGRALPADIKVIKGVPEQPNNHIIESIGKGHIMCPIYPAEEKKNSREAPDVKEVDPVFDPSSITKEIWGFHIEAKKRALLGNT
jgi:hypothetical protein